jgi:hypothetical protein
MLKDVARHTPLLLPFIVALYGYHVSRTESVDIKKQAELDSKSTLRVLADRLESMKARGILSPQTVAGNVGMVRFALVRHPVVAKDWRYDASRILRMSPKVEDKILAHDLAVLSVSDGVPGSLLLAAKTEDEMLLAMGQKQHFGTVTTGTKCVNYPQDTSSDAAATGVKVAMGVSPSRPVSAASIEQYRASSPDPAPNVHRFALSD